MTRTIQSTLLILILVLAPGTAVAGPLDDAMAAFQRSDSATALKLFRPLAEQGDPTAQLYLGVMFVGGAGVAKNEKEGAKWFRLSAAQGNADAQCNLGLMYVSAQGVAQDLKEAAKWYRLASDQGNARAQFSLGAMYLNGFGLAKDEAEAERLLRLSAEQNNPQAQSLLGDVYTERQTVETDPREAATQREAAAKWYRLAAQQGDADAQFNLGVKYEFGNGVAQDDVRALMWFSLAGEKNEGAAYSITKVEEYMSSTEIAQAKGMAARCKASGYKDCD